MTQTLASPTARGPPGSRRWWPVALGLPAAVFVLAFHVRPVAEILWLGFAPAGDLDVGAAFSVLGRPGIRRVIEFTLWQALASTALTLVLALPMAQLIASREFRGRRLLESLLTVPFVLPTTVVGAAFLVLLAPDGPLPGNVDLRGTLTAVLVAHAFFNYAVVVRLVGSFWAGLDPDLHAAAQTLGASPWQRFVRVTLPTSLPAIASAASVVFLFTFTSLGVILILGGPGLTTLEVEILRQTRDLLDLPAAAALAVVQLAAVLVALLAASRLQRRAARILPRGRARTSRRPIRTRGDRALVAGNLALAGLLLALPVATLVTRSFRVGATWSLSAWTGLGELRRGSILAVPPAEAIGNTLWFGLQATVLAVILGTLASLALAAARNRGAVSLDALLALPLGTSAVTVGFGFLVALDTPPFDLRTSAALIPIAHAVVALPFVVRVLLPAVRALDGDQRRAARTLGATPTQAFLRTDARAMSGPLATAAAFAFAISAGEFGATVFIARPDTTTVPLMILRLLAQPGEAALAQAMALAVILLVVVTTVVLTSGLVGDRLDRGGHVMGNDLHLTDLAVGWTTEPVLSDVYLDLAPGEIVALLGESGSGKSTLLRTIAGLLPALHGTILLGDRDITTVAAHRRSVGMVFQAHALFPHATVGANVSFAASLRGADRSERHDLAATWLERVGLAGLADRDVATLSGGQRQRVALARTLAAGPDVVLLDEPLGALDAGLRAHLLADLRRLFADLGTTVVHVTHDPVEAASLAHRLAVLDQGHLVQVGPPGAVHAAPASAAVARLVGHPNVVEAAPIGLEPPAPHLVAVVPAAAIRASPLQADQPTTGSTGPTATVEGIAPGPVWVALVRSHTGVELSLVVEPSTAPALGDLVTLEVDSRQVVWVPRHSTREGAK